MVPDERTGGPRLAAFCGRYVLHTKGRWAGKPLVLEPWQREFVWEALEVDPATGLCFYTWQGRELPSVTRIRRIAGLPHGLHQWAINQVISHTLDHWPELTERLAGGDPGQLKVVRHELRSAATALRDRAASLGTAVHDAAARRLSPLEVPPEVAPRLRQYLDWLAVSGAEVLATERQVWDLTLGYAGSFDLLVRLRDGSIHTD